MDYRQGPEHKLPAAHDDAIATYDWALKNAASMKGDPTKMALVGESAGGGLAVATAIAAREKKMQMPRAIVSGEKREGKERKRKREIQETHRNVNFNKKNYEKRKKEKESIACTLTKKPLMRDIPQQVESAVPLQEREGKRE